MFINKWWAWYVVGAIISVVKCFFLCVCVCSYLLFVCTFLDNADWCWCTYTPSLNVLICVCVCISVCNCDYVSVFWLHNGRVFPFAITIGVRLHVFITNVSFSNYPKIFFSWTRKNRKEMNRTEKKLDETKQIEIESVFKCIYFIHHWCNINMYCWCSKIGHIVIEREKKI